MARVPFVILVALAGAAAGQPRPDQAPPWQPPGAQPKIRILEPNRQAMPGLRPGEEQIDDPRPFLAGKVPNPKDFDPETLKRLMDQLNKMPKDQQPDRGQ